MKTSVVIFSAGKKKENDTWFSLMKIGSIPMIQRIYIALRAAGIESIAMFCSVEEKEKIERLCLDMPMIFVGNENIEEWKQNIICDRFILAPTNYPFFTIPTIMELLLCEYATVLPNYEGKVGYPIVLPYEELLHMQAWKSSECIRQIKDFLNNSEATYLSVNDEGICINIDDEKEYKQAFADNNLLNWYPKVKFRIANEEPFFGPGSVELLTYIEKTESVRLASEEMQMSYSKSWKLLNELEKQCGYEVLTRTKGGKGGGQTTLTARGKALLEWYETLKKQVDEFAVKLFLENLPPR